MSKKKEVRAEMSAQSAFSADGPALFMEGGGSVFHTIGDKTYRTRIWQQPAEVPERTSKRVLRLRRGKAPRATTKV